MANESLPSFISHVSLVRENISLLIGKLLDRAEKHDFTKTIDPERSAFDELQKVIDADGPAERGTPEYHRRTGLLGEALSHHYTYNSHHPEHYPNGIAGMDLIDLVEMVCDWRAANVQRDGGAPMSLSYSIEKYGIDPQLASILKNTVERLGWGAK